MAEQNVVIVTGANKGIGFATVKLFCERHPDWIVYLTARDVERGQQAVKELQDTYNLTARFHQLDIGSVENVRNFADFLRQNHPQGVKVLVNNAGAAASAGVVQGSEAKYEFKREMYRMVVGINYFGLINVANELYPLLADGARVVNVSSRLAQVIFMQASPSLQEKFKNCSSEAELTKLIEEFVELPEGNYRKDGWVTGYEVDQLGPQWNRFAGDVLPYAYSKLGVNVLTQLQQKHFDNSTKQRNVAVNACTPGMIKTAMNLIATKMPEEGAEISLYLATIPQDNTELRGKFVDDRKKVIDMFVLPQ